MVCFFIKMSRVVIDRTVQPIILDRYDERLEKLWSWLGDAGIFFMSQSGNVLSTTVDEMINCFEYLEFKNPSYIRYRLTKSPSGLHDPMEILIAPDDMRSDEVAIINHGNFDDYIEPENIRTEKQ